MVSCVIFVYSRLSPYFNTKYSYYIAIASIPSESLNSHWDRVSFKFENQTLRFTIAGVIFTTTRIYQPETDRMFVTTWFLVFQNTYILNLSHINSNHPTASFWNLLLKQIGARNIHQTNSNHTKIQELSSIPVTSINYQYFR